MTHRIEDSEEWPSAAIMDQLIYERFFAKTFNIDFRDQIRTTQKYFDLAKFLSLSSQLIEPFHAPIFIIKCFHLSQRLQNKLGDLKIDHKSFGRVVMDSIQWLLEGINSRYFHISGAAFKTQWRFDF